MTQTEQSEWHTRKRLIDPKLQAAGWRVVTYDPAHPCGTGKPVAIEGYPTDNGPADYALCVDGQLLGLPAGYELVCVLKLGVPDAPVAKPPMRPEFSWLHTNTF